MTFKKLIIYIMRHFFHGVSQRGSHLPRKNPPLFFAGIVTILLSTSLPQAAVADLLPVPELIKCIAKIMNLQQPTTLPHIRHIPQIEIEKVMTSMKPAPHRRGVPVALYIPPQIILMSTSARADDLAHEIAHHFQYHNDRPFTGDEAERDAETVRRAAIARCS